MSSPWQRFCRLSRLDRHIFFQGIFLLPVTACMLRFFGVKKTKRLLDPRRKHDGREATGAAGEKWRIADAAVRMTEAASRYGMVRGNCLSKSMVIWHLLRRHGLQSTVHVGGRKDSRLFEAHAWVELDGRTINDSEDVRERFAPFGGQINNALTREK